MAPRRRRPRSSAGRSCAPTPWTTHWRWSAITITCSGPTRVPSPSWRNCRFRKSRPGSPADRRVRGVARRWAGSASVVRHGDEAEQRSPGEKRGGSVRDRVDTSALAVTRTVALGTSPARMAMAPDGHVLYVTVASGGVLPVDPASGTVGPLIPTSARTYDVESAVDTNANDVRPVDLATGVPRAPP